MEEPTGQVASTHAALRTSGGDVSGTYRINRYFISTSSYEIATLRRPAATAWTGRCQARKRLALSVEPLLERGAAERGVRAGKQAAVLVELVVRVVRVAYLHDS